MYNHVRRNTGNIYLYLYLYISDGNLTLKLRIPDSNGYLYLLLSVAQLFASRYLSELARVNSSMERRASMKIPHLKNTDVIARYEHATSRLILLDYDEALCSMRKHPELVMPSRPVIHLLKSLSQDPKNHVYILSGCPMHLLESWFGHLSDLGIM
jgi:trehalose 6-phosphate synthase/phosphatase